MIFRQFFDPETSTYTYLLADPDSRDAILIDPVLEQFERDTTLLAELDLRLRFVLETHVHADHVTSSGRLREALGCQIAVGVHAGVSNADLTLADDEVIAFGGMELATFLTPGHTDGCATFFCAEAGMVFTGDALLIRGCGRTDFQQGDAATLLSSVRGRIFSLPDETRVYPGHDYHGRTVSSVEEEKRFNPRMGLDKSLDEFVQLMEGLKLAYPKKMDVAVPANLMSGLSILEDPNTLAGGRDHSVADVMERSGRQDAEIWMGVGI